MACPPEVHQASHLKAAIRASADHQVEDTDSWFPNSGGNQRIPGPQGTANSNCLPNDNSSQLLLWLRCLIGYEDTHEAALWEQGPVDCHHFHALRHELLLRAVCLGISK